MSQLGGRARHRAPGRAAGPRVVTRRRVARVVAGMLIAAGSVGLGMSDAVPDTAVRTHGGIVFRSSTVDVSLVDDRR